MIRTTSRKGGSAKKPLPDKPGIRKPFGLITAIIIISIATWVVYLNTHDHSFHFDDTHAIVHNTEIRDFKVFGDLSYWTNLNNRPLSYLTFALNYQDTLPTTPFHRTNILIHLLSSIFLYLFLCKVFLSPAPHNSRATKHASLIALFAALVFALHPIQTQSVTYIVQRMSALSGLFILVALWLYLSGRTLRETASRRNLKRLIWYTGAALAWLAALLSKQEAAFLPLMVIAAEFILFEGQGTRRTRLFLGLAATLMITAGFLAAATGYITPEKGAPAPMHYLATQLVVIVKYIQLAFLPVHQMVDYGWKPADSLFSLPVIASLLIHLTLLVLAGVLRRKNPLVSLGIFLFYLPLAVTSTIFPIRDMVFEHRMYLSLAGFAVVLASMAEWLFRHRNRRGTTVLVAAYLILLGYGTIARNKVWKDTCTLWEDTLRKAPANTRAWLAVGDCLKQRGDMAGALEHYNRSLEIDSLNPTTLNNRGNLRLVTGDTEGALADYNTLLRTSPESRHLALLNRGIAYTRKQDYLNAIKDFTAAIETGNAEPQTWFHRGVAYVYLGDYPSAIADLKLVAENDPANQDALFNLASSFMNTDRFDEAVYWYSKLLNVNPGHLNALQYRGSAYLSLGQRENACADWQKGASRQHSPCQQLMQRYCTQN